MAKIYRQQRHSRDEDDSASDDEDSGLCVVWLLKRRDLSKGMFISHVYNCSFCDNISVPQFPRGGEWRFMSVVGLTLPEEGLEPTGGACYEEVLPTEEAEELS